MSVNCKEIDAGGIGELVNPLQWPQLRKKRRLLLLAVTPVLTLLPFPFVVMLGWRRPWCSEIGLFLFLFPPVSPAPPSILFQNLPEPPPLPKVCNSLSTFSVSFSFSIITGRINMICKKSAKFNLFSKPRIVIWIACLLVLDYFIWSDNNLKIILEIKLFIPFWCCS